MKEELKQQLHALVDSIEDTAKLQMLMEDAEAYLADTDKEDLTEGELAELDEAIAEAERGETISWEEFKNKLEEWQKK